MADTTTLARYFSVRAKPAPKVRKYRATWPCGSTWDFDRHDLSAPIYRDGKQMRASIEADTMAEMIAELRSEGATVERL